jgi:hypothetical protein
MAHRDRSQGFGFIYVDIAKLLSQRDELATTDAGTPIDTMGAHSINFNKPAVPVSAPVSAPLSSPVSGPTSNPTSIQDRAAAITQIRENLDRLKTLHHRLHSMLEELNQIADRKKKN